MKIRRTSKQSMSTSSISSEIIYCKKDARARMQSGRTSNSREEQLNCTSKELRIIKLQLMNLQKYQTIKDAKMSISFKFLKRSANLATKRDLETTVSPC